MRIKDQIRIRREALGMDMHELAQRVGVTEQAVRHWENGRSYPSKAKTRLLEQALSFSMDWSEGENPVTEGKTAAAMVDKDDVDLLLTICRLPLRAKQVMSEFARMHLEAVDRARASQDEPEPLDRARAAVAATVAAGAVARAKEKSPPRRK